MAVDSGLSILSILAFLLVGVGTLVMMIFGIIILIKAFQESVLWGLGSLFVPFVSLVFVIKFWDRCKKPMIFYLVGLVVFLAGIGCLAPAIVDQAQQLEDYQDLPTIETPAIEAFDFNEAVPAD